MTYTKEQFGTYLLALISTIEEVKEAPKSSLYLPFMEKNFPLGGFEILLNTCIGHGICTVCGNLVKFTQPPAGSTGDRLLKAAKELFAKVTP